MKMYDLSKILDRHKVCEELKRTNSKLYVPIRDKTNELIDQYLLKYRDKLSLENKKKIESLKFPIDTNQEQSHLRYNNYKALYTSISNSIVKLNYHVNALLDEEDKDEPQLSKRPFNFAFFKTLDNLSRDEIVRLSSVVNIKKSTVQLNPIKAFRVLNSPTFMNTLMNALKKKNMQNIITFSKLIVWIPKRQKRLIKFVAGMNSSYEVLNVIKLHLLRYINIDVFKQLYLDSNTTFPLDRFINMLFMEKLVTSMTSKNLKKQDVQSILTIDRIGISHTLIDVEKNIVLVPLFTYEDMIIYESILNLMLTIIYLTTMKVGNHVNTVVIQNVSITKLPMALFQFKNVRRLKVKNTNIDKLAFEGMYGINKFGKIQILELPNNKITTLDGINNLKRLATLEINGNPIQKDLVEVKRMFKQLNTLKSFSELLTDLDQTDFEPFANDSYFIVNTLPYSITDEILISLKELEDIQKQRKEKKRKFEDIDNDQKNTKIKKINQFIMNHITTEQADHDPTILKQLLKQHTAKEINNYIFQS